MNVTYAAIANGLTIHWGNMIIGVIIFVVVILSILFNGSLALAVALSPRPVLQTHINVLIISLAISLIISAMFNMVFVAMMQISPFWIPTNSLCAFLTFSGCFGRACALETVSILSIGRYLAVAKPFKYRNFVTKNTVRGSVLVVWLWGGTWSAVPVIVGGYTFDVDRRTCAFTSNIFVFNICLILSYFIPMLICLSCLFNILYEGSARRRITALVLVPQSIPTNVHRNNRKAMKTLVYIICTYLLLTLPYTILISITTSQFNQIPYYVIHCFQVLSYSSCVITPALIFISNKIYRDTVRKRLICKRLKMGDKKAITTIFSLRFGLQFMLDTTMAVNGLSGTCNNSSIGQSSSSKENTSRTVLSRAQSKPEFTHYIKVTPRLRKTSSMSFVHAHTGPRNSYRSYRSTLPMP